MNRMKAKRLTVLTPKGSAGNGPAGLARKADGLPRIEEIARDERDRDAGQDVADDEVLRQSRDHRAQADDDHELAEVVDEEPKETVDVAGDKPGGRARASAWGRSVTSFSIATVLREVEQGMRQGSCPAGPNRLDWPAMALSKKDQEFYEDKLSVKWAGFLFLYTALVGAVGFPGAAYLEDAKAGMTGMWTVRILTNLVAEGFLLGIVVAVTMYLAFKLLLQLGWLPSRR